MKHPKAIENILTKPLDQWTARDLGIVTIYDSMADQTEEGYDRLFDMTPDLSDESKLNYNRIRGHMNKREKALLEDYITMYLWVIGARRCINSYCAVWQRTELTLRNQLKIFYFAESINAAFPNRDDMPDLLTYFMDDMPEAVMTDDKTKELEEMQDSARRSRRMIAAYNKTIDMLQAAFKVPNLKNIKVVWDSSTRAEYTELYNKETAMLERRKVTVHACVPIRFFECFSPDVLYAEPVLPAGFEKNIKGWIKSKAFYDPLDAYPYNDIFYPQGVEADGRQEGEETLPL